MTTLAMPVEAIESMKSPIKAMQAGIPSSPVPEHAVLSLLGLAQTSSPAADWSLAATAHGPSWTKSLTRNDLSTACIAAPDNLLTSLFGEHRGTTIKVTCSITGAPITLACTDNILSGAGLGKLLSSAAAQPGDCFMLSSNPVVHDIVSVTIAKSTSPAKTIPSSVTAAGAAGLGGVGGGLGGRRRSLVTPLFQDTAPTTDRKSAGLVDHQLLTLSSNTTTTATPAAAAAAAAAFAAVSGRFVSVSRRESLAPATVSTKKQGTASVFKSDSDDHHHYHHAGLDLAAAEAAAALAAAADDEEHLTAAAQDEEEEEEIVYGRSARSNRNNNRYNNLLDDDEDPDWGAKPQRGSGSGNGVATTGGRGRPRKKRAGAGGRRGEIVALSCVHCGTQETPRWWKDNFPCGTLCNACGIWLKRHGYPRPVQFFVNPAGDPQHQHQQQQHQTLVGQKRAQTSAYAVAAAAQAGSQDDDAEFYLINGRPKRRRALALPRRQYSASADGSMMTMMMDHHDGSNNGTAATAAVPDIGIQYDAAGSRVFVIRRKLNKVDTPPPTTTTTAAAADNTDDGNTNNTNSDDGTPTTTTTTTTTSVVTSALVHFGWAPTSRQSSEMYDKVMAYGESSLDVTIEDFELLSECKATATLCPKAQREVDNWDALVKDFVNSL